MAAASAAGRVVPLLIVLALELVNEALDFTRYYIDGYPWGPGPMLVDIALTMLPPLAIVLAARWDSFDFYRFRRRPQGMIKIALR